MAKKTAAKKKPKTDILPPQAGETPDGQTVLAIFQNHAQEPEKLLEALEAHDPGFIKRLNKRSEDFAEISRAARFRFGQWQAYTMLAVRAIGSFAIFGAIFYAINQQAGVSVIIGLTIMLAVAQGGPPVWRDIARAIIRRISNTQDQQQD